VNGMAETLSPWLTRPGRCLTILEIDTRGGIIEMNRFWRFWDRLEMWQRFGLAFVVGVTLLVIVRTLV